MFFLTILIPKFPIIFQILFPRVFFNFLPFAIYEIVFVERLKKVLSMWTTILAHFSIGWVFFKCSFFVNCFILSADLAKIEAEHFINGTYYFIFLKDCFNFSIFSTKLKGILLKAYFPHSFSINLNIFISWRNLQEVGLLL